MGPSINYIRILNAGLLKILQYLTRLRTDNSSQHRLRSAHVNSMIIYIICCLGCFHRPNTPVNNQLSYISNDTTHIRICGHLRE